MKNFLLAVAALICLSAGVSSSTVDFNHFWTLAEINAYLQSLTVQYPSLVSLQQYGVSSEGNALQALVVRKGSQKSTIVVEAGLRPREWVSPMSAIYIIHEIVEHSYDHDDILDFVDLVFITVANPDGYAYSMTTDRNWNKNRRSVGGGCFGADLNHNFGYHFVGTSNPCDAHYTGPYAFSEAETLGISRLLDTYEGRVAMYLSLQAFGSQILFPYNYIEMGSMSSNQLYVVGYEASYAIAAVNGREYDVGVGGVLHGIQYGTSMDYAYETRGITRAFTIMLPRGGTSGWDVPVSDMPGIISEAYEGYLVFVRYIAAWPMK